MTTELVIMNTSAVAMAADSAGTVRTASGLNQTYNSANKLFNLSYDHSVGIMVYGGSSIHHVPWETIIKMYRKTIKQSEFSTLDMYAENFIKYLTDTCAPTFSRQHSNTDLYFMCHDVVDNIYNMIVRKWRKPGNLGSPSADFLIKQITEQRDADVAGSSDSKAEVPEWRTKECEDKLCEFIDEKINSSSLSDTLNDEHRNILRDITLSRIYRGDCTHTGIVFAGFGEDDIFPRSYSFNVYGLYCEVLRIEQTEYNDKIGSETPASVTPYAQTEMVETFMMGINPSHYDLITEEFAEILYLPVGRIDNMPNLTPAEKDEMKVGFFKASNAEAKRRVYDLVNRVGATYSRNILDGLSNLSKDELADVTGAMLRLSTLYKQVSVGDDSVGGPIDVAIISKGDGLIWINRKHYFKPELNPHFLAKVKGK